MISLLGTSKICENIAVLSAKENNLDFKDFGDLEIRFHDFLKKQQPDVPRINKLGVNIIKDEKMEQDLANLYYTDSGLDDMSQSTVVNERFDAEEFLKAEESIKDAISFIEKSFPEIYFTLQLAIDSIFIRKSEASGGGSTSNGIGIIWINNREHWTTNDLIELLVHELTHNLVFIDELRYLHYPNYDLILSEENYSDSAILHTKRPIDKVVHSIIVATEVVSLRKNHLGEPSKPCVHPPSDMIISQTLSAYNSLTSMPNYRELATERTQYLMDKCYTKLKEYQ